MGVKKRLRGVLAFLLILLCVHQSVEVSEDEQAIKSPPSDNVFQPKTMVHAGEMATIHGYPGENHIVVTEDGYILTVHRIPHGRRQEADGHRPVIFLQHGLLFTSACWMIKGPQEGLAFILSDAGFDVWMGNFRGNTYSIGHINDSISDSVYWNFSMHEMAKYDVPAMIDHALIETNAEKLFYIGHSTGANVFYMMCALRPEYNSKIKAQFSLAPDAIFDMSHSPTRKLGRSNQLKTGKLAVLRDVDAFSDDTTEQQLLTPPIPMDANNTQVCRDVLTLLGGPSSPSLDQDTIELMKAHFPSTTSRKTIAFYSLTVIFGNYVELKISKLDDGRIWYEVIDVYNIMRVDVPVHIYYSKDDIISTEVEADYLLQIFPKSVAFQVPSRYFSHLDFLWGRNVTTLVFDQILLDLQKYQCGPKYRIRSRR